MKEMRARGGCRKEGEGPGHNTREKQEKRPRKSGRKKVAAENGRGRRGCVTREGG